MKKLVFAISAIVFLAFVAKAQYNTSDIFNEDEIIFFGLDFSRAKLVGTDGFSDPQDIQNRLFDAWNNLFISESDKYDLSEATGISNVNISFKKVNERNQLPDAEKLVTNDDYSFGLDVVEEVIASYREKDHEGIGLLFVIESFNKPQERGYMWVTFFDISSGKVLLSEKMSGKARGFGIRNYYAKTYFNVIKEIGKTTWEKWSNKY